METATETTTTLPNGNGYAEASIVPASQHPRAILTKQALDLDTEQRKLLREFVSRHMVKGTDYGEIPGTDKPTLLKPGAEKLVDLFRCTPKFKLVKAEEDFDRGHGFFNYIFRVQLVQRDSGAVLAEGYGSANSREGRYRWRNGERKCPNCGKSAIIKGKEEYGGGWLCFAKKGGCGSKWKSGAKEIESQEVGKVENDDIATLANTILKMAKKRCLVDGSIALARCSDMFTQDVEDLHGHEPEEKPAAAAAPEQKQESKPAQQQKSSPPPSSGKKSAPAQASARQAQQKPAENQEPSRLNKLWTRAKEDGVTPDEWKSWVRSIIGEKTKDAITSDDLDQLEVAIPDLLLATAQSKVPENAPPAPF